MALDIQNPPVNVNLESLARIATSLECSTTAAYCRLAGEMNKLHNPVAVETFERLVALQRDNENEISTWAHDLELSPPQASADELNPDADDRDDQAAYDLVITPWQALNLAVRNSRKSFEYLTTLAANANSDSTRQQAEFLASRKLEHIALLRQERMRAWRTEERSWIDDIVGKDVPQTLALFQSSSAQLTSALQARYLDFAHQANAIEENAVAGALQKLAIDIAVNGSGDEATPNARDGGERNDIPHILRAALRETEAVFDAFMSAAAKATEEDITQSAQEKAADCVLKLESLRDILAAHYKHIS